MQDASLQVSVLADGTNTRGRGSTSRLPSLSSRVSAGGEFSCVMNKSVGASLLRIRLCSCLRNLRGVIPELSEISPSHQAPSNSAWILSGEIFSSAAQYSEISANDSSGSETGNMAPPLGAPARKADAESRCGAGLVRLQTLSASVQVIIRCEARELSSVE